MLSFQLVIHLAVLVLHEGQRAPLVVMDLGEVWQRLTSAVLWAHRQTVASAADLRARLLQVVLMAWWVLGYLIPGSKTVRSAEHSHRCRGVTACVLSGPVEVWRLAPESERSVERHRTSKLAERSHTQSIEGNNRYPTPLLLGHEASSARAYLVVFHLIQICSIAVQVREVVVPLRRDWAERARPCHLALHGRRSLQLASRVRANPRRRTLAALVCQVGLCHLDSHSLHHSLVKRSRYRKDQHRRSAVLADSFQVAPSLRQQREVSLEDLDRCRRGLSLRWEAM